MKINGNGGSVLRQERLKMNDYNQVKVIGVAGSDPMLPHRAIPSLRLPILATDRQLLILSVLPRFRLKNLPEGISSIV